METRPPQHHHRPPPPHFVVEMKAAPLILFPVFTTNSNISQVGIIEVLGIGSSLSLSRVSNKCLS